MATDKYSTTSKLCHSQSLECGKTSLDNNNNYLTTVCFAVLLNNDDADTYNNNNNNIKMLQTYLKLGPT